MKNTLMEPLPLFDKNFDPYDLMRKLAKNQEGIAEQTSHNAWMLEQLTEQMNNISTVVGIMYDRLVKLENENEKD